MKTIVPFKPLAALLLLLLILSQTNGAAQSIPPKPNPPRLVNDYANLLSLQQVDQLENKLVRFNDTTSTQIAIVIVNSLGGYDKASFAYEIGEQWGVGQQGFNNGIVVLLKPKTAGESGEIFIATGYGLEGAIPDAITKRIIENEMKPLFMEDDYFTGLDHGTNALMALASGEYSADQYKKSTETPTWAFLIPLIIFILILVLFRSQGNKYYSAGKKSIPWWTALWILNSMGKSNSGSWGEFKGCKGGFGGGFGGGGGSGGGGFGGFGGGSFGGGGAGGSW